MGIDADDMNNTCTVNRVEPENADITSVYIEGYDDKFRERKAGQYLTLRIREIQNNPKVREVYLGE